ncbi:VWA domain-containing protein [bacterium]|nr:VWA domain-containing protein [bacterium]
MIDWRRWSENWLGIEPVAAGEDTQWSLRYALGWPDWLFVLFVAGAVALVVGIYWTEAKQHRARYRLTLALLRILSIGLIVVMLGGLELIIDRTGLPYLVLMLDDSESMSVRDQPTGQQSSGQTLPRLERVIESLSADNAQPLRQLTKQHKLQLYTHSGMARLVGTYVDEKEVDQLLIDLKQIQAKGPESKIGTNVRSVLNTLRGTPPSAVVLLTDGISTQGESLAQAAQYAARKSTPIFTVGVGDPGEMRDWEVRDLLVDDTVFVGDLVTFQVKLSGRGMPGESATIQLKRKDLPSAIDEKTVRVPEGVDHVDVELSFRPTEPGSEQYEVVVPIDPREPIQDNNRVERRVEAIKEKVKVLYVESYPRYEFRFLKSLLEREETVDLSVLLADADPEYLEEDRVAVGFFPTTREELNKFDVILIGDIAPSLFSAAQVEFLREFVRVKGGGIFFVAGPQANPKAFRDTPLEELLPIDLESPSGTLASGTQEEFHPRLTTAGKVSPIFRFGADEAESTSIFEQLPGAYWYVPVGRAKPAASVLAEHPTAQVDGRPVPILATQFFGAGRTIFQGFTGTWRWRNRVEDLYFARYWIQSVRLLSRSKLLGKNRAVEMLVDRRRYRRGDPVQITVRVLDESLLATGEGKMEVSIDRADGTTRTVGLARRGDGQPIFEGLYQQTDDGQYRVRLTSPAVEKLEPIEFTVLPPPGELDRVQMNEPELRAVAAMTRGTYHPLDELGKLFAELPPGRKVSLHTDPPIELWNKWPMLLLLVGLLTTEWILRKRKSLI